MCVKVMYMCVKVMYICVKVMYMCVKGIDCVSFYNLSIGFWKRFLFFILFFVFDIMFHQCYVVYSSCDIMFHQCYVVYSSCDIMFHQCYVVYSSCDVFVSYFTFILRNYKTKYECFVFSWGIFEFFLILGGNIFLFGL